MAANALPIVLLAGGALLLAGGKKKRRRKKAAPAYEVQQVPPTKAPAAAAKTSGPSGKAASSEVWKGRQTALAFVAGMKVCNSHPGSVDGVYGPATLNAIIAFQICAGIDVDGKWGPATDTAMKKMLVDIARGQVKVSKPPAPKPASKPSSKTSSLSFDVSNPTTWPSLTGKILTPQVRDRSWLPNNMGIVLPDRDKEWWMSIGKSAYRGFGAKFYTNRNYDDKDYALEVGVPVVLEDTVGYQVYARRKPSWIEYYFKVASSLRNLATMYPQINFSLNYNSVKVDEEDEATVSIYFVEEDELIGGIRHPYRGRTEKLERVKLKMMTPTPTLVETIAQMIEKAI